MNGRTQLGTSAQRAACVRVTPRDSLCRLPRTLAGRSGNLGVRCTFRYSGTSKEIPPVSGNVEEDCNSTIGLGTRCAHEGDAGLGHSAVRGVEVVDTKKEPDPSGRLMTNGRTLVLAVGAGKKKPGFARRVAALPPTVSGARRW